MPNPQSPETFKAVEQRIAIWRQRLPQYSFEHGTLTRLIAHIQKRISDHLNARLKAHGLNHVSYNTLMMIFGSPDGSISPTELSRATGEKPANLTRVCDELVARGLIERKPALSDRRGVVLRLHGNGERLLEEVLPQVRDALGQFYIGLSDTEMQQLRGLLHKVLANLEHDGP